MDVELIPIGDTTELFTLEQMREYAKNVHSQRQPVAWRWKRAGWTKWMYSDEYPHGEWLVLEPLFNR